jgi:UDP-glucose 4-epimerase
MALDLRGMSFLVAGGCGFVGTNVTRRLLELQAERVVVLDDYFTGQRKWLPEDPRIELVEGSVSNAALLDRALEGVDYVLNLAAVNIIAAQKRPELDLEVNALGSLRVLQAAAKRPRIKKVLYTSSASIYGNPEYLPIHEDVRARPMSNYAVSKLAGENYAMVQYLIADQPTCVVRYSNVYGPYQAPSNPYCGVVGKFMRSVLREGVVTLHGTGQQTRDFTFVDDAVDATILATVSPKAEGCVFNVATGYEISILDLARKIFELVGKEPRFEFVDKRDIDNISRRCLNIEHVRTRLKWEPRHTLDTGIAKTLAWFRTSPYATD